MSPSTILLHEGDHALKIVKARYHSDIETMDDPTGDNYDQKDEKRLIPTTETQYINNVNSKQVTTTTADGDVITPQTQATRTDHRGSFYATDGVNSITPTDGSVITGVQTVTLSPMKQAVQTLKKLMEDKAKNANRYNDRLVNPTNGAKPVNPMGEW
jgi:hypothetical protein